MGGALWSHKMTRHSGGTVEDSPRRLSTILAVLYKSE